MYNVPPSPAPTSLTSGDTLNLFSGGLISGSALFHIDAGGVLNLEGGQITAEIESFGEINLHAGTINSILTSRPGSKVNLYGGSIGAGSLISGATWNLRGGQHQGLLSVGGYSVINIDGASVGGGNSFFSGTINLSAGSLGGGFNPATDVTMNMKGGTLQDFKFGNGSVWNLSGGLTPGDFEVSVLHIRATSAYIAGSPISAPLGQLTTIVQRNVTLSGILPDGSPYSFDLNSGFGGSGDRVPVNATVTVTLVPEPATAIAVSLASMGLVVIWRSASVVRTK